MPVSMPVLRADAALLIYSMVGSVVVLCLRIREGPSLQYFFDKMFYRTVRVMFLFFLPGCTRSFLLLLHASVFVVLVLGFHYRRSTCAEVCDTSLTYNLRYCSRSGNSSTVGNKGESEPKGTLGDLQ